MTLFSIDSDACGRDGLCAAVCPVGCIEWASGGLPAPSERKADYCIRCGHCVAVCPHGALRLDVADADLGTDAVPLDPSQSPAFPQVEHLLMARRSTRVFRPEPPDRDLVARLLDLTQYAPSGHNARPVAWAVVPTPEAVRTVAEAVADWMRAEVAGETPLAGALHLSGLVRVFDEGTDLICRNAPMLAVAHAPVRGITPLEDGIIATTYLELAAAGAGLGTCWCGYLCAAARHDASLLRLLAIPEGSRICGALMLGRAAIRFKAAPPRQRAAVRWL
jgi:nitroreductase/NAD-dependent dihydropyrimidine dehydrogenase PreA subunit